MGLFTEHEEEALERAAETRLKAHADAMDKIYADLERVGREHDLFQRALWIALGDNEVVVRPGYGGLIEYVQTEDGGILVRRKR